MLRFSVHVALCCALTGCVPEPGENLSASVAGPTQVAANQQQVATAATSASEPVTKVIGASSTGANAPAPRARPSGLGGSREPVTTVQKASEGQTIVAAATVEPSVPSSATAFAPVQGFIPQSQGAAEVPLLRVALTPASPTRFDASRGGYGYSVPEPRNNDESLQISPRSNSGAEQTTPRVTAPGEHYYAAYTNTEISCFPQALREAINTIAQHYGVEVEVTSGMRHNGRRGSYHRKCMAADIRVAGVSPGALATFSRSIQGINGVGTYRHNNVTHIDVRDYQMSWRY